MERFQRNDTDDFACVQTGEQSVWAEIWRVDEEKLGGDIEQGMTWLPAEKQPEVSLARQVEARS